MNKIYLLLLMVCFCFQRICLGALPVPDVDDDGLILPPGFHALVYADNLVVGKAIAKTPGKPIGKTRETLRGLAVAPNGDVYAKERVGLIFALRDANGDGRADVIQEFGPGDGGTHIMFHNGSLYHSSATMIYRYKYIPGELVPSSPMEVVVSDLPAEQPGKHDQKAFAFDESGHLLVLVGAPFNVFKPSRGSSTKGGTAVEQVAKLQETAAGFWQFDADRTNQHFADGMRFTTGVQNCLALTWHPVSKKYFMCMMGRDALNTVAPANYDELDSAERVAEEFHQLKPGGNIGWPYSYWDPYKKARMLGPEYDGDGRKRTENPEFDPPLIAFPAHWSPEQMCLYDGAQFPERYRNGMFLAFHGSWNRAPLPQAGYKVVFIPFDAQELPTGKWEHFIEGIPGPEFYTKDARASYRPCGVAVGSDGSLYVSDTEKGRIWRIIYTGVISPAKNNLNVSASGEENSDDNAAGNIPPNQIFTTVCAACHMADGQGVPNMQPPLVGSAVVAGDSTQLINVLLKGPAAVLPADRPTYNNAMPPFNAVSDADIADVINYLRDRFAPAGAKVTPQQVATQRAKL